MSQSQESLPGPGDRSEFGGASARASSALFSLLLSAANLESSEGHTREGREKENIKFKNKIISIISFSALGHQKPNLKCRGFVFVFVFGSLEKQSELFLIFANP